MKVSVFVNEIKTKTGMVHITATNGGREGPPSITWEVPYSDGQRVFVGKRYLITIEEGL